MKVQTSLGWIAGLVLTTSALATALLTERVNGVALLGFKSGETAYATIDVGRAGEKFWGDFSFQKVATKFGEGIQFRALSIDTFKIAPGMAYMDGVGIIGAGKEPGHKTHYTLTVLDFNGPGSSQGISSEADLFELTIFDAKNNAIQFTGWVIKGDLSVTVTEP